MSKATRPPTQQASEPALRRLARPALAASVVVGLVLLTVSSRSSGGPTDPADGRVHKVGSGSLPTERPKLRAARAPLSPTETGYAATLAAASDKIPDDATDVRGADGPQVLFIDLPRFAEHKDRHRLVTVTLYDYTSDRGYQVQVDLTADEVTRVETDPVLQPPPADDESQVALDIVLASDHELTFRHQFEKANGVPLLGASQVRHSAGIWTFDGTGHHAQQCGEHRCVRLLVEDRSGTFFDTSDFVVDLTTKSVVSTH
jgi:hypothetical protein